MSFPYELTQDGFCKIKFLPRPKRQIQPILIFEDDSTGDVSPVAEEKVNECAVEGTTEPVNQIFSRAPTIPRDPSRDTNFPMSLFGRLATPHNAEGVQKSTCYHVSVTPNVSVAELKTAFRNSLPERPQASTKMTLHHVSYANNLKFGLGDIRLEDGRIGRFLDPEGARLSSFGIKNGDFFEISLK